MKDKVLLSWRSPTQSKQRNEYNAAAASAAQTTYLDEGWSSVLVCVRVRTRTHS